MNHNFNDLIKAIIVAAIVVGAAVGFGSRAKAGPLDQGPHILIAQGWGIHATWAPLASYSSKEECLAVRDSLFKAFGKAYGVLACIPGRNTEDYMRDNTLPPRTTTGYLNETPTGYVVKLYVKRDDGQDVGTQPCPTIKEAFRAAEELATSLGYKFV